MTGDDLLHRLTVLYGPPDTIDAAAFADEYRAVIRGAEPRLVALAVDHLRDSRLWRNWPTPGEVKAAITAVAYRYSRHVPPEHQKFTTDRRPPPTPEEIAEQEASRRRVNELAEGWIRAMRGGDRRPGARPVELPWMDNDEFEVRMATIPDRATDKGGAP